MPRRKNKQAKRRQVPRSLTSDHVRREWFSTLKANAGAQTYPISPANLGTRIAAIADLYGMYRVVKLRVRFHPTLLSSRTGSSALCYVPGVTDTAPSSWINICETPSHLIFAQGISVASRWLNLSAKTLASYETWYKTIVGTPDPAQEIQGNIYLNGSAASDPSIIEMEGIIEFRACVEAGATPQMRREKLILDEAQRLQGVLAEAARITASRACSLPSPLLKGPPSTA